MTKARSRLKSNFVPETRAPAEVHPTHNPPVHPRPERPKHHQPSILKKYVRHLPLLCISLPCYWLVYLIASGYYPEQVADILIPQTFLVFLLPFFLANLFLFSFLFLNSRRGLMLSLLISILFFFKLNRVVIELWWLGPFLIFFVALESGMSWRRKI